MLSPGRALAAAAVLTRTADRIGFDPLGAGSSNPAVRCLSDDESVPRSALNDTFNAGFLAALDQCAFWPVPNTRTSHLSDVSGLAKVLVVAATNNPAAPDESGMNPARALGGTLLPVKAKRHMAVFGDSAVAAYLIELKLPAEGMKCI
ncbi:alpha/beta hydrolase [Kibdelosporangium philippinense]|uniref:Alpha/beta hydrolase n=1 Tax=Kibdelosporangium philippinense TaxID=211113 RepID=A0ABS8ZKG7_9PSEU|nr:alpha/beta hydrolase [Kibdelosporangium philippinense]MCE7008303.1 alpha/beta hydrolase [Kibdelosporangium philippinense]